MPSHIACIVEGHGEVEAVPILIRRIAAEVVPEHLVHVEKPLRVAASKLLKAGELETAIEFTARRVLPGGAVLVLLDCDDGCPAQEAPTLLQRAVAARPDLPISVVLAKCEFEAWFLAAAVSLRGCRGLPGDLEPPSEPEGIRAAKGWFDARMPRNRGYAERLDQPALTARFDLDAARGAPSFDKLYRDVSSLLRQMPQE